IPLEVFLTAASLSTWITWIRVNDYRISPVVLIVVRQNGAADCLYAVTAVIHDLLSCRFRDGLYEPIDRVNLNRLAPAALKQQHGSGSRDDSTQHRLAAR